MNVVGVRNTSIASSVTNFRPLHLDAADLPVHFENLAPLLQYCIISVVGLLYSTQKFGGDI